MINSNMTSEELIKYYCSFDWGNIYEDDKYYEDYELMDNFIIFYVYCFAWLGLPRPSRMQLEIAKYIGDRSNPHRLVWSPRGIA